MNSTTMSFITNMIISLVSVAFIAGLLASWCVRTLRNLRKFPCKSELKLRGLPVLQPTRKLEDRHNVPLMESEFEQMTALPLRDLFKGRKWDEMAPLCVSYFKIELINDYLSKLKNTPESIEKVAKDIIEVLMFNHQSRRSEVEQEFVDIIFSRALENGSISHLYAKLLKRLRSGNQKGWTQNIARLLFQLAVEEFNRPLPSDDEINGDSKLKKLNNVKLMAAIFKREIPGVPDGWITDCADTLVHRLGTGVNTEQSIEELICFLKTLFIAEPGENCDPITPSSRQRQLLACVSMAHLEGAAHKEPQHQPAKSDATTQTLKPDGNESNTESDETKFKDPQSAGTSTESGSTVSSDTTVTSTGLGDEIRMALVGQADYGSLVLYQKIKDDLEG
jgi:hypothetical protein